MKPLAGREKTTLLATLWLVAIAGIVSGVVFPLYLRLENFNVGYREQRYQLREAEKGIAQYPLIKRDYEQVSAKLPSIRASFLPEGDVIKFIETLEGISRKLRVYKEIRLSAASTKESGAAASLSFQLTIVGPFEKVFEFLARLENLPYATIVDSLNMTRVKDGASYGSPSAGTESESYVPTATDVAASVVFRVYTAPER